MWLTKLIEKKSTLTHLSMHKTGSDLVITAVGQYYVSRCQSKLLSKLFFIRKLGNNEDVRGGGFLKRK